MRKRFTLIKKLVSLTIVSVSILSSSITAFAEEDIFLTNDRVNFRSDSSLDAEIYDTLNYGTQIDIIEFDAEGWSRVAYNGMEGYIKSEFLRKKSELPAPGNISEVQLLDWSDVKNIFTTYTPAQVYDVYTGLTYNIQSFSNGLHADVETLTQEDTDIMLATFGGTWSWEVRPIWVTVNGYTLAASINGMPHGGGTIANNGLNGQVCIHFRGSTTHNGNKVYAKEHQDFVTIAYNAAR